MRCGKKQSIKEAGQSLSRWVGGWAEEPTQPATGSGSQSGCAELAMPMKRPRGGVWVGGSVDGRTPKDWTVPGIELVPHQMLLLQLSHFGGSTRSLTSCATGNARALLRFWRIIFQGREIYIFSQTWGSLKTEYFTLLVSCLHGFWGEGGCDSLFCCMWDDFVLWLLSGFFHCYWFSVVWRCHT